MAGISTPQVGLLFRQNQSARAAGGIYGQYGRAKTCKSAGGFGTWLDNSFGCGSGCRRLRGGGGGSDSAAPAVVPPKLSITPTGGEAIVLDGAALIAEETDGSGNAPLSLGTITDDKDESGDAVYHLAEDDDAEGTDNGDFRITNNVLFYKGAAVDFESATKKSFNIKILRYKNAADAEAERSPQTLDSTINLQDQIEVLGITPPGDASPIFSDGASLLQENADGSTNRIEIGAISDNIKTTLSVSYRLADASASNNNGDFQIENGILYYIGTNSGDFDAGDFLMVDVIRTIDGNAATEQTLQRTINLKDIAPDITATEADGTTEIDKYLAASNVANDYFRMVFDVSKAHNNEITIRFVEDATITLDSQMKITPLYVDDDPTNKLTGFEIGVRSIANSSILSGLTDIGSVYSGIQAGFTTTENYAVWQEYLVSVAYVGPSSDASQVISERLVSSTTLTGRPTIEVDEGTSTSVTIANFASADTGSTYSLGGDDAGAFTVDANGNLRFAEAPNYDTPADKDTNNFYGVSVTADDGTSTDTYDLLVVVADVL